MLDRRSFMAAAGAAALTGAGAYGAGDVYDAVVGGGRPGPAVPTLTAALDAAQAAARPFRIFAGPGIWRERVEIDVPGVSLTGAGADRTVIVAGAAARDLGPDGKAIGTFRTATAKVTAPDFRAAHLTIANDFDYDRNLLPGSDGMGAQAVALALQDRADRSLLTDVVLTGHQDTLYVDSGRSLFRDCRIAGCVDFIFGAGRALFETCEIVSRHRPGEGFNGYVAAPDTDVHQPVGFVFSRCRLTKEAGVAARSAALGRPWRHTKTFPDGRYGDPDNVAACAYLSCWMDDHIVPEGWRPMGYNKKGGGRAELTPEEVRFFEYDSRGPGAGKPSATRRMLTAKEAQAYSREAVLTDWKV